MATDGSAAKRGSTLLTAARHGAVALALLCLGTACGGDEPTAQSEPSALERTPEIAAKAAFFETVRAAARARKAGALEEAARLYRVALAADPEHEGCLVDLARTLRELGRPEEALVVLERLHGLRRDLPRPSFLIAEILAENDAATDGDLERAVGLDGQALDIEPNVSGPRLGLARVQRRRGLLAAAEEAYRTVLGTNPDSQEALVGLALTLLDRGAPEEAAPLLVRALEIGTRPKGRRDVPSEMDTRASFDAAALDAPANQTALRALARAAEALGAYPDSVPERFRVPPGPR
jgi:tetratricopeptide (TPR) repeat protein